jgi:hypothetical protein
MVEIPLTQGKIAIVDDCDDDLANLGWYATKSRRTWYAQRNVENARGKMTTTCIHRIIGARMSIAGQVDHRDRNGLNCSRKNLRPATFAQNAVNKGLKSTNKSGYKGVSWHKHTGRWLARANNHGETVYLGLFDDPILAAQSYDRAIDEYYGEYAVLNFPKENT